MSCLDNEVIGHTNSLHGKQTGGTHNQAPNLLLGISTRGNPVTLMQSYNQKLSLFIIYIF